MCSMQRSYNDIPIAAPGSKHGIDESIQHSSTLDEHASVHHGYHLPDRGVRGRLPYTRFAERNSRSFIRNRRNRSASAQRRDA
jgi:hypothetical protein